MCNYKGGRVLDSKEVLKKLKENGFVEKSQKGSHKKLIKENLIVIVPVHGKKDIH